MAGRLNEMKLVFIHIPRTGGGTFQNILSSWYLPENCWPDRGGPTERQLAGTQSGNPYSYVVGQHRRIIHGHFPFNKKYKKYFLCTFLRNPVEQVISRWSYHKTYAINYKGSVVDFAKWGFVNMQSKYLKGSTLNDFDFVGITERYPDSMKIFKSNAPPSSVEKWINITDWDEEMAWQRKVYKGNYKNASPRKSYPVTDEEKEILRKMNDIDFKLYNEGLIRLENDLIEYQVQEQ